VNGELVEGGLALDSQQAEEDVAAEVAVGEFVGVGFGLFLYLKADDLLVCLLLPVGVVAEDVLLEGGDVVV
jgi:hypothetical protein